jgi:hypothetical protein
MLYGWISTVEIFTINGKLFSTQFGMLSIALFYFKLHPVICIHRFFRSQIVKAQKDMMH